MNTAAEPTAELSAELQERIDRYNAVLDTSPDADPTEILPTETAIDILTERRSRVGRERQFIV